MFFLTLPRLYILNPIPFSSILLSLCRSCWGGDTLRVYVISGPAQNHNAAFMDRRKYLILEFIAEKLRAEL